MEVEGCLKYYLTLSKQLTAIDIASTMPAQSSAPLLADTQLEPFFYWRMKAGKFTFSDVEKENQNRKFSARSGLRICIRSRKYFLYFAFYYVIAVKVTLSDSDPKKKNLKKMNIQGR